MASQGSFINAVKWAYVANCGERAFSALFTLILAALLGPREFGIVTIALIYVAFLQMFLDQGFVAALIQKKDLDPEHMDAVFWMNLVLSLVLVGLSILLSRWWAAVNHLPEVAALIAVLSLCIPVEGLAIVQKALLQRTMDFRSLSLRANLSVLVGGFIGVGMAFEGFRIWALVGQQIVRDLAALALLWKLSPWRPRFEFSWKHLKDLSNFSTFNFAAQLGMFADMQTGAVLLGMLFGPEAVGLYRFADRLMNTVLVTTTSSVQTVSLPEFSRFQDKPAELRKSVLSCIRLSSTATLPAMAGLAAVSGALMATIGPEWAPASDVLKVLCILGMALIFAYFTGPLMQALAKTHEFAVLEWARTLTGVAFLVVAGFLVRSVADDRQVMAIALARFMTGVFLVTPTFLYILIRLSGISFRDLTACVFPSALASVSVVGAVALFQYSGWLAKARPSILLAADVAIGVIVGLGVLLRVDAQLRLALVGRLQRSLGYEVAS